MEGLIGDHCQLETQTVIDQRFISNGITKLPLAEVIDRSLVTRFRPILGPRSSCGMGVAEER